MEDNFQKMGLVGFAIDCLGGLTYTVVEPMDSHGLVRTAVIGIPRMDQTSSKS